MKIDIVQIFIFLLAITYFLKMAKNLSEKFKYGIIEMLCRPFVILATPIFYFPFVFSYLYVMYKHFVKGVLFEYHIVLVLIGYFFLFFFVLSVIISCYNLIYCNSKDTVLDLLYGKINASVFCEFIKEDRLTKKVETKIFNTTLHSSEEELNTEEKEILIIILEKIGKNEYIENKKEILRLLKIDYHKL